MGHYILFSFVLLGISAISNLCGKKGQRVGFWICLVFLMVLAALRGSTVGNDTEEYIDLFRTIQYDSYAELRYEIGYIWLNRLLVLIWDNPQIIIIVSSIFIFYSYGRFICKYSNMPWLSLFIFFTFGFYGFAVSGIRQSLAIAILLFSYKFIIERKFIKYLVLVVTACLFHGSALLFLPAYLTNRMQLSRQNILMIFLFGLILMIGLSGVTNIVFQYFNSYESYANGIYGGDVRIASVFYVIVSLLIILLSYRTLKRSNSRNTEAYKINGNITLLVCIAAALYIISLKLNIFDRVAMYYNVFAIIVLPNSISRIKSVNIRQLVIITVILFFFLYNAAVILFRPEWNSVFPYSFFF